MNMSLQLCEARDPKGLYKLARAGKIKGEITTIKTEDSKLLPYHLNRLKKLLFLVCLIPCCSGFTGIDDPYESPLNCEV